MNNEPTVISDEKWAVTANHSVLARPDRYGMKKNEAMAYADSLIPLGYEDINVSIDQAINEGE